MYLYGVHTTLGGTRRALPRYLCLPTAGGSLGQQGPRRLAMAGSLLCIAGTARDSKGGWDAGLGRADDIHGLGSCLYQGASARCGHETRGVGWTDPSAMGFETGVRGRGFVGGKDCYTLPEGKGRREGLPASPVIEGACSCDLGLGKSEAVWRLETRGGMSAYLVSAALHACDLDLGEMRGYAMARDVFIDKIGCERRLQNLSQITSWSSERDGCATSCVTQCTTETGLGGWQTELDKIRRRRSAVARGPKITRWTPKG
jgi:hypothetical protein